MFEEDHAVLEEVKAFLQSQPWAGEYEIFFSDRTLLEVTARGATKGGMVARLAERLGISRQHIYCAGDEANDLSMLTWAAEWCPSPTAPVRTRAPPSWQMRTTTLWRTSCPAWTKCTPERRKHRSATCGSGNSRFGCWHVPVSSGILNV